MEIIGASYGRKLWRSWITAVTKYSGLSSETIETEDVLLRILSRCKYFECVSCTLHSGTFPGGRQNSFYSLLCVGGKCGAENQEGTERMDKGRGTVFLPPAGGQKFLLEGEGEFIITHI